MTSIKHKLKKFFNRIAQTAKRESAYTTLTTEVPEVSLPIEVLESIKRANLECDDFTELIKEAGHIMPTSVSAWTLSNAGLAFHCFAGGVARAIHFGVLYGLLLGVMAIPGHTYASTQTLLVSPWVMKLLFGPLTDAVPLFGFRRKYYAVIGWTTVAVSHFILVCAFTEPIPYYCSDLSIHGLGDFRGTTGVCNYDARKDTSLVIGSLLFANIGLVLAESAGDGLLLECVSGMTEFTERSSTQIEALVIRMIGGGAGSLFLALCFNSRVHLGFYDNDVGMQGISIAVILLSMFAIIGWIFLTANENKAVTWNSSFENGRYSNGSICRRRYCSFVAKMCKPEFIGFLAYQLSVSAMLSFTSPAIDLMRQHWAHVQQMQQQLTFLGCAVVYAIALYILHKSIDTVSWHNVVRLSVLFQAAVQTTIYWITAADHIRDQYFFLMSDLLQGLSIGVNFVIATLSLVEMTPRGHEATVYGMVGALYAISPAIGRSAANFVYGSMSLMLEVDLPSIISDQNYIADSRSFRALVLVSVLLAGTIAILSLLLLPMLPDNATSARRFLTRESKQVSNVCCCIGIIYFFISAIGALLLNAFAIIPSTACHPLFGGVGCE
jgi:hypothetical protein